MIRFIKLMLINIEGFKFGKAKAQELRAKYFLITNEEIMGRVLIAWIEHLEKTNRAEFLEPGYKVHVDRLKAQLDQHEQQKSTAMFNGMMSSLNTLH